MKINRILLTCASLALALFLLSGCNVIVGGGLSYSYGTYWVDDDYRDHHHHRPPPNVKPEKPHVKPKPLPGKPARPKPSKPKPKKRPAKRR